MTKEWARIESTVNYITGPYGEQHRFVDYRWIGSKYAVVYISYDLNGQIPKLPWPVKIIEENIDFGRSARIIRKDVGWHLWWILVFLKRKITHNRPYQHFKWRVIMTFDLWGLGYQPEGEVTSWKNIGRKRK
jgi:hypothetical protein